MILIWSPPARRLRRKRSAKKASFARSQTYHLDATNPEANMGVVVNALSESLKIPPDQIAHGLSGTQDLWAMAKLI